ncbi:RsmB/NOP family class I SAM-dependent RNA methyltransferase [Methyloligella solikamskensis]|uniref:RsmB/NOP family class I SAM-dependent RNA methyltransferase n=1 Tax=Methyloligella solikamskensis TaxID=1177756 RepID=A0ABW3J5U9_9HYPH
MASEAATSRASEAQVGLAARRAAADVLTAVLIKKQPLDLTLGKSLSTGHMANLPPRDRALTRAIVMASLRHKGQLDAVLLRFLEKGFPAKSGTLYAILLSAAAQLIFLETPPHAAIGLAVTLAQYDHQAKRFDKLANAVLRKVSSQGPAIAADMDAPKANTPEWLWERWSRYFGEENARAIAELNMLEPPLDLTVKSDPEGWANRLGGHVLPGGGVRLIPKGRIEAMDGYDDGAWWVQDLAASLPAKLFKDIAGKRVLDLCAAPGGKTAQLAAAGASVLALDISEARLKVLKENIKRLGLACDTALGDASTWYSEERFDAILLDAPCSSTGTIRRHPDIAYLKTEADLPSMVTLQRRLLDNAAKLLKPGGTLVFSTCSLEPEEGEGQIASLLTRNNRVSLDPIAKDEVFGHANWLTQTGTLRTIPPAFKMEAPGLDGMDGFFAARLVVAS